MRRDLHDGPLQNVFATMIRLDLVSQKVPAEFADELRLLSALQGRIIRQLREVCQDPRGDGEPRTAIHAIDEVVMDATIALGFSPACDIDPAIDDIDDRPLVHDVMLTVRECLSNVARHARATSASVKIAIESTGIRLEVTDNGTGVLPNARRGNGFANLRSRAEDRGGTCTINSPTSGGTAITWRVPLSAHPISTWEGQGSHTTFDGCFSSSRMGV